MPWLLKKEPTRRFLVEIWQRICHNYFVCAIWKERAVVTSSCFNVAVPPTSLELSSQPEGKVTESVQKTYICQIGPEGSNPASEISWIQLSRTGEEIPLDPFEVQVSETKILTGDYQSSVAQSKLTIFASRQMNSRRFECSVNYLGKEGI
ncbi:hypothetical protein Ciccas_012719, partial [Cichlidogyrus casuarinus]